MPDPCRKVCQGAERNIRPFRFKRDAPWYEPMNQKKDDMQGDLTPEESGTSHGPEEEAMAGGMAGKRSRADAPEVELPPDLAVAYQKVVDEKRELYDRLLR